MTPLLMQLLQPALPPGEADDGHLRFWSSMIRQPLLVVLLLAWSALWVLKAYLV